MKEVLKDYKLEYEDRPFVISVSVPSAVKSIATKLSEQLQAKSLYYGAKIYDKLQQLRVLNRLDNLERDFNNPGLTDSNLESYIRHIVRSEVSKPKK